MSGSVTGESRAGETPGATTAASSGREVLLGALREQTGPLLGAIQSYVWKLGAAREEQARIVALDVLQEVTVEALAHADHFAPGARPVPWLLGIAVNVIRRRKAEYAARRQHEQSLGSLAEASASGDGERGRPTYQRCSRSLRSSGFHRQ